jgi:hypothetical protein
MGRVVALGSVALIVFAYPCNGKGLGTDEKTRPLTRLGESATAEYAAQLISCTFLKLACTAQPLV